MKFNKYLLLATILISAFPFLSQKALSQECPFDSYMIINGKCYDMSQEKEKSPLTSHKTIYYDSYRSNTENFARTQKKECSDFTYQESAQRYFDRNREEKHLDSDRDGYACDNLNRLSNDILTSAIWKELLNSNIKKRQSTKNTESLSYSEVIDIIGFYPNASKGSRTIWEDPINNMAIKIRFHQGQIMDMKGVGF